MNTLKSTLKPHWQEEKAVDTIAASAETSAIILYNDDVNTFDHVISCLMKYCGHAYEQAGQCALLVHTKGKTDVKHGSYKELRPIWEALLDAGLSAKIEM